MNTMPGTSNGGRSGNVHKKKDVKIVDTMRGACPPHRRKDLDSLIKLYNGDEEKIQAKIQEWWEEPQEEEEKWEDVNKKGAKPKVATKAPFSRGGGSGGRAPARGGRASRGGAGAGGRGGKDGGREGRGGRDGAERRPGGRGRGGQRFQDQENVEPRPEDTPLPEDDAFPATEALAVEHIPTAPAPKGAWSVRASAAELNAPIPDPKPARPVPQAHPEPISMLPPPVESRTADLTASHLDSSLPVVRMDVKPVKAPTSSSGNVWATKGSAHLIQAEKPKVLPPPAPLPPPPTQVEQVMPVSAPIQPSLPQETIIETLMPSQAAPSVTAWSSPVKPKQVVEIPPSPVSQPPLASMPTVSAVEETIIANPTPEMPVTSAPKAAVKTSVSLPTNVLNMGHWETGEGEDSQNLDFGFGSFGPDSDVGIMDSAMGATQSTAQNSAPPAMSPARPPPGLSISGMPPIPANAVLVHELENGLENTSLNPQPDHGMPPSDRSMPTNASGIMSSQQHQPTGAPVLPQQNYGQYSMAGVYGYGTAGNGFMGVHTPVLAGGVIPQKPQQPPSGVGQQQQQQQLGSGVGISLAQPQHSGLYGSAGPSSAGSSSQVTSDTDTSATAPIPPSIPGGAMPYNPVYYGQQPFHHMGQPQGGIGYNYGYGAAQFGGAGGFGYQQVMGQSGAYGAPPYDDQAHPTGGAHHAGSAGGYQKSTGYRGRGSHHSGSQYQNQYNPPSGYGAQPPYGMGYGVDHFNQRYAPQGAMDPYMQQQQQQQQQQGNAGAYPSSGMHRGSFPDEEQYKKKGGRNNNNNNGSNLQQQFPPQQQQHNPNATQGHLTGQQQQQQQQQQQHSFGLPQSGAAPSSDTGSSTGGWSNHHGGGGWGGGVPSWQGS